ncbi:TRAP transporter small permease subunit [Algibacillus agarilyticus]|uniref:TRAP transporter small permease subunit n=1 Tax=Algibacillus agarilyticus TaxID=2234133 RepID=UPI000DCFEB4B|nr:TRAP transporter small permease subunit [Algibacillus agarilyticus]
MNLYTKKINAASEWLGNAMGLFTLIMVLLMAAIVILRYGFDVGTVAMQEGVLYLHGAALLLGAGYTLKHDDHVRVDVFYRSVTARTQHLTNFIGHLFLLMPVVVFVFVMSFEYVLNSWDMMETSPEPGGLAFVYIQKSLLLLFCVCLFIQALAMMINDFVAFRQLSHKGAR